MISETKPSVFSPVNASGVAAYLTSKSVMLTASQSLAVDWKRRLVSENEDAVCETPAVLGWQAWLKQLASDLDTMPVALNRVQESWLWEQVVRTDLSKRPGMPAQTAASVRGLARHAREAYALMQEYRMDVDELAGAGDEADALLRWIGAVHDCLRERNLTGRMLAVDVGAYLLDLMHTEQFPLRIDTMLMAGFDVFTPMQTALLAAVQAMDIRVIQVIEDAPVAVGHVTACADMQSECRHIAGRIAAVLEKEPQARIGVVTAEAMADTALLKRRLDAELMPEWQGDAASQMQAVVMDGDVLTDTPMIRQLLQLLALAGEFGLSFDECSGLLFLPWLKGYDNERFGRAELDATFRRQNRHRLSFSGLLKSSYVSALPELSAVLKALAGWKRNKRSANEWVKAVHELLKATGFVQSGSDNEARRSNHEIRQMNAFRDVLISLVAVDAMGGEKLSWMQFLSLLRTGCAEVRLAPLAKFANVMVLPLAQMGGLQFDYLFVMGMDEEAFPPPARPYALLPASLQKKYALPMSSGTVVYAASELLWQSLLRAAPTIDISYARQRDDKELLAASFVADLETGSGDIAPVDAVRLDMEVFDDESAVPLPVGQAVRGGTSIIRNQSACPFRAFATHRLGISELGETTPGIEASSKGSLIHLALEYLWRELGTQAALAGLDDAATVTLIDAAIEHAWQEVRVVADSRTREFEQKRMRRVLLEWFELELNRPAFRVAAIEQEYLLALPEDSEQQFTVKIKADRMDVDASGRRILIDYKTGAKQSTAKWLVAEGGELDDGRIEEPQLPQYALAAKLGEDDAVAFARVRSGDMAFEGLSGDDIGIKGIVACDGKRRAPDDWPGVLDDWKTNIDALATEFIEGRCDVSPRDVHACDFCGLEAVCRIEEMGAQREC